MSKDEKPAMLCHNKKLSLTRWRKIFRKQENEMLPAIKLQLGNYLVVCSLTLKKYICLKKHEQRALSTNPILKYGLEQLVCNISHPII